MGSYVIRTPDIGEGIAEVELVAWHVKPGDSVAEDQVLADVMTDKATVEIPSPVSGTVLELVGDAGTMVAVGADLVRLEVEGAGNRPVAVVGAGSSGSAAAEGAGHSHRALAEADAGSVAAPRPPVDAPITMRAPGDKPLASPAVRRRAREIGIELQFVHGSGPAGRVEHGDLDIYLATRGKAAAAAAKAGPRPPAAGADSDGTQAIPLSALRKRIAQKMQEAKRRIPHFSYVEEIDVTELEALRAVLNTRYAAQRGKLTVLPLIARAVVLALRDFPQMNARFDDDAAMVTRYSAVHLGVATQTSAGLMVPVVHDAQAMDPWAFAAGVSRLAEAARAGKVTRNQLSGSTITLSSLGPLGGVVSTPVINHPEVAIVGVNRIVERPMLRGGQVVARQLMNLSSSFDHRVVDGMEAAEFIQAVRALLETPALLFVE